MPLTRRNVVQSSSPAKKARTSRTGTPKEGEPENPKETLGGKAENGSNMGVNPDEMVSRRSGRQRTVSKRLQDMHIDFGPKKSALKRQREVPTARVEKTKVQKKQKPNPKNESAVPKENTAQGKKGSPSIDGPADQSVATEVAVTDNMEVKDTLPDGNASLSDQLDITDPTPSETLGDIPDTNTDFEETSTNAAKATETKSISAEVQGASNNEPENESSEIKSKIDYFDVNFAEEGATQAQPEGSEISSETEPKKTLPLESNTAEENALVGPNVPNSLILECHEIENDENFESVNGKVDGPTSEISDGREEVENDDDNIISEKQVETSNDTIPPSCLPGENVTWIQLENIGDGSSSEKETPVDQSKEDVDIKHQEVDEKRDVLEEGEIREDIGEMKGEPHQFVVLEDGRQLILSNADTLATAADAVASLAQLKDIGYTISDPTNHTATDKTSDVASVSHKDVQQGDIKIKFINITSDNSGQNSITQTSSSMVSQPGMSMRPGPPTLLSQDGYYRCTMCVYKTEKKANWYKHRYTHIGQRRYQCDTCNYKATSSSNLKRHMLIHSDTRIYQCDICSSQFRQKIHLERHYKYKHEEKNVKCDFCDYVCSNVNPDLKVHMKRKHITLIGDDNEKLQYRCDTCGFVAATNRDLKQHQKFHRPGPELKLYCEFCSFVTDCASRLKRHLLVHSKERPFVCKICPYRASQKEHILRHHKAKHKDIPYDEASSGLEDLDQEKASMESSEQLDVMPVIENVGVDDQGHKNGEEGEDAKDVSSTQLVDCKTDNSSVGAVDGVVSKDTSHEETSIENKCETSGDEEALLNEGESVQTMGGVTVQDLSSDVPGVFGSKKKYKPADFSNREKVFFCIHCTMKFAKLINLYKHLAVQHKDVHATRTDGLHSCVWCDYQTNKWKNLLVHMRKHNYREGEGTGPNLYTCVVCSYSHTRRRTLYAHMMRKHKFHFFVKPDGTANCMIDDTVPGTMMSSADGTKVVIQPPPQNNSTTLTENTQQVSQQIIQGINSADGTAVDKEERTQMVMIELEPGMPATAVEISAPNRAEDVDHEAADAIEGLQALAEQVIAVEQEQVSVETQVVVEGQEVVDGQGEETTTTSVEGPNIELSAEQIMQLSSGDYIEINGEMYKVEVAEDVPNNAPS